MGRTRIKMCGIRTHEDVKAAIACGADAIGFVFYHSSPRSVTIETASELSRGVGVFVDVVALLVNAEKDFVEEVIDQVRPSLLQFHGSESARFCEQFEVPYIKAIPAKSKEYIEQTVRAHNQAKGFLIDTYVKDALGGTGHSFDWELIPSQIRAQCILAGGLSSENVGQAIRSVRPFAVDVSSGIESIKGIKDAGKMNAFARAVQDQDQDQA